MKSETWLILLLIIGMAIRLGFWCISEPTVLPDTETYIDLARQLLSGDFSTYEGRRTPGYPLLLLFVRFSPHAVWLMQMIAGLGISLSLYYIAYAFTGKPGFAFIAGMTYNLNLAQLCYETSLIPETETTFFVASTAALIVLIHRRLKERGPVRHVLIVAGICAGCAMMARPQFIFLPFLLAALSGYGSLIVARSKKGIAFVRVLVALGPGVMMILGVAWFNYVHIGYFTLSTQSGITLTEHTIAFAELASDRYASIRDVAIRYRDIHLAQTGRHTAIWDAIPELKTVTRMNLPDLDRQLARMSIELIINSPFRFALLVGQAWVSFWLIPNPKGLNKIEPGFVRAILEWIWWLEHLILRLINFFFLVFLFIALLSCRFRVRLQWNFAFTSISTIIVLSSVIQAVVAGADNARYGVTVQPLIVLVVIAGLYHGLKNWNTSCGI